MDVKKRFLILGVLLMYLAVVSTHIFYLPRATSVNSYSKNAIFKRKFENIHALNNLERTYKAVIKETIKSPASILADALICTPIDRYKTKNLLVQSAVPQARAFHNLRYSYRSLCVMRI